MKKISIIIGVITAGVLSLSSCIKDLDALPLNPTDHVAEVAYGAEEGPYLSGLARIYNTLYDCWTASNMGNGSHGSSCSAYWWLNEGSSDTMVLAWSKEVWTDMLNYNAWTSAAFEQTHGLYGNALLGATFANEFLNQTTNDKLTNRGCTDEVKASIRKMRAEARILRAYHFFTLVDIFGQVSLADESHPIGKNPPPVKTRAEAFNWLITELNALVDSEDTPAAGSNFPRVDKGVAQGLLIRLYLNAEVFTGNAMWAETKSACEKLFKMNAYDLCENYAWLFCGDNGTNPEATQEIMFSNYQDRTGTAWNWGGATNIIASSMNNSVGLILGFNDYWGGVRMPYEYVERYFKPTGIDYETGDYTIADKRGQLFYIKGREQDIEDPYKFEQGWGVHKYSNLPHDKTWEEYAETAKNLTFADTYVVYMRLAEMYLAYAESCLHTDASSQGLAYINKLRTRAGVPTVNSYDENFLFEEYSRELYWEGGRRRDLIRFDKFSSGDYLWSWKGGHKNGQSFPEYKELYNIPTLELQANPNLKPNPGY